MVGVDGLKIEPLPDALNEKDKMMTAVPIGVLVSSDRAFGGTYEDKGGPGIETYLKDVLTTPWRSALVRITSWRRSPS